MSIISNGGAFMYAIDLAYKMTVKEEKDCYSNRVQLDEIMKKIFYINNNRLIIDLLNGLYGDDIGYDADIKYLNKEAISNSVHEKLPYKFKYFLYGFSRHFIQLGALCIALIYVISIRMLIS